MSRRSLPHDRSRRSSAALSAVTGMALVVSVGQQTADPIPDRDDPQAAPVRAAGSGPIRPVSRHLPSGGGEVEVAMAGYGQRLRHREAQAPARRQVEHRARALAALRSRTASNAPGRRGPATSSSSIWDRLARCESGGDWSASAGFYEGGLQFRPSTWDAYRPAAYPGAAYRASRRQQILVAKRVRARQGWDAWPVCSRKLGLR